MSGVQAIAIAPEDGEIRLDRWFKRHFPTLGHGRLEKLLRTGQVRVDGKRAHAGDRVSAGQIVRVPPLGAATAVRAPESRAPRAPPRPSASATPRRSASASSTGTTTSSRINKPHGLAVQGGTGTAHHLDGLLDALRFEAAERPRLVHRLDKDTSGVLLLARNAAAAAPSSPLPFAPRRRARPTGPLSSACRGRIAGAIDLALAKLPGEPARRWRPTRTASRR